MNLKLVKITVLDIKKAARGSLTHQRLIFMNYYPYAMAICLRYLENKSEAEEALNDSFIKIFNNLRNFDQGKELKHWISKIVVNTCIDRLRSKRNKWSFTSIDQDFENRYQISKPVDIENPNILNIMQRLPAAYRAVFNLYVFEEYKHKEIAQLLGISEGTSKSNYSKAKAYIMKHVTDDIVEMKKLLF